MSDPGSARPRPVTSVLDLLRKRIDHATFDAALFSLDAVAADLGYGDVRALGGSIAWIDRLRSEGKKVAVVASGERAAAALDLAGIGDRFDAVVSGLPPETGIPTALEELGVTPDRALLAGIDPSELQAARAAGVRLVIGVARGSATPEQLRRASADAVVADLQELLRPA
jgi:beta-phosphoglucomutase-like phosphatase (HAD superfamily)